jgi:Putative transposase/Transposase zinc-binding domain
MPGLRKAGRFDIADIVRAHRAALESVCALSTQQRRVLDDIERCRTAALGGHIDRCTKCDYEKPSYNSCRNRHCPKCQALAQEKWIAAQEERTLDVQHFHVVFTLPAELRSLARFAPRIVYEALFQAASCTLLEFGKRRRMTIGATLVLHTWTRALRFHPHVHAIVSGGGLSRDSQRWITTPRSFLFPIAAMAKVFRAKVLDELRAAYRSGDFARFDDFRDPEAFDTLVRKLAKIDWHLYAKRSFARAAHIIKYLGRYTHRVGLSNSRLLAVNARAITFRTKGVGKVTVTPVEFLRRFVFHVLPDRFHKIRHVGLNASRDKRELVRFLLRLATPVVRVVSWQAHLFELTSRDPTHCPRCGARITQSIVPRTRDPPYPLAP